MTLENNKIDLIAASIGRCTIFLRKEAVPKKEIKPEVKKEPKVEVKQEPSTIESAFSKTKKKSPEKGTNTAYYFLSIDVIIDR